MPPPQHGREGELAGVVGADRSGHGPVPASPHVMVCGLGDLGTRIVELLDDAGTRVTIVDRDGAAAGRLRARSDVAVVHADAAAPGVLERAGLAAADAVICVEDHDLRNLRVALLAREHRPGLRVVTALTNAAVGRALHGDTVLDTVLDVAALATPTVVEACFESPVHDLDVAGERFLSASTRATRPATLRDLYGDLVPLAVSHEGGSGAGPEGGTARDAEDGTPDGADDGAARGADDGRAGSAEELVICPGRDHVVGAGDRVTLLGTPDELAAADVATTPSAAGETRTTRRGAGRDPDHVRRPGRRRLRRGVSALRQLVRDSERGMAWALVALVALIVVSTVVLRLGYSQPGMSVVDALYFTIESVATVGFGDYSFADQPIWLRLWAVFLMLAGVVTTAIPIAFFTDTLISRRLSATAGRRRASAARGHVVLVGLGAIGIAVLTELRSRGADVVVLERDTENRHLDRARALRVPVVFGDATSADALAAARVQHAAAVAVLTSDDMANIETGLAARDVLGARAAESPVVLRVLDHELARTVGRRFGFRAVHSVVELAAPRFVGAALGLDVLGSFPVHRRTFLLGRLVVAAGSGLDGLAMRDLSVRTRVVALRRARTVDGGLEHPPRRDTRFAAGDEAFVLGPYTELLDLLRRQRAPQTSSNGDGSGQVTGRDR